jgi:hypothetical protein
VELGVDSCGRGKVSSAADGSESSKTERDLIVSL